MIRLRLLFVAGFVWWMTPAAAADGGLAIDTALIVSIDVSSSVDAERYRLQMEGMAQALEDPGVIKAIQSGPAGAILFTLVTWADRPALAIPWTRIGSESEAKAVAAIVRTLPQQHGDFTCLARMLRFLSDKIVPLVPVPAGRTVIDVSGDGSDNCNPKEPAGSVRDELADGAVTINGLPILEGREAQTLEGWYNTNVVGGPSAFLLPAKGFADFGRAIRHKFVEEISWSVPGLKPSG